MIRRLGLEFPVLSDPSLRVVRAFGLENPEVGELSLHAIYMVDQDASVFYRKVARRRPYSPELFDAVDHHRGEYTGPDPDEAPRRRPPWKGWRLIDSIDVVAAAPPLPDSLTPSERAALAAISNDLELTREDPALRKWRSFCRASLPGHSPEAVLRLGHRLMRAAYLDGVPYQEPLAALREASSRLDALRDRPPSPARDAALGAARNELQLRATALGDLSQGHLRSLWDLKSMLKAMEELHAAEVRAAARRTVAPP